MRTANYIDVEEINNYIDDSEIPEEIKIYLKILINLFNISYQFI